MAIRKIRNVSVSVRKLSRKTIRQNERSVDKNPRNRFETSPVSIFA